MHQGDYGHDTPVDINLPSIEEPVAHNGTDADTARDRYRETLPPSPKPDADVCALSILLFELALIQRRTILTPDF